MAKKKTSAMIREAKQHLWNGRTYPTNATTFICFTLNRMRSTYGDRKVNQLQKEIDRRLQVRRQDGHIVRTGSLRLWLSAVLGVPHNKLKARDVQRHRLQWMEMLEAEYEAKGD